MASSWLLPRVVELAATYVVQSTLFLAGGWGLLQVLAWWFQRIRRLPAAQEFAGHELSPALIEGIWKASAALALLTAPLSVFTGWSHPAWEWSFREERSLVAAVEPEITGLPTVRTLAQPVFVQRQSARPTEYGTIDEGSSKQVLVVDESPNDFLPFTSSPPIERRHFEQQQDGNQIGVDPTVIVSRDLESGTDLIQEPIVASREVTNANSRHPGIDWFGMVLVCWFAASAGRLMLKSIALRRFLAGCTPIEGDLRRELNSLTPNGDAIRLVYADADRVGKTQLGVGAVDLLAIDLFDRAEASAPREGTRSVRSERLHPITEPFACGLFRWAIVLPAGIERELSTAELKGLLAHEVAHLVRRDPWWLLFAELLCTCLAFQPLNFLARRRWQQVAELRCDDWAVEQHASATALASCLTRIAEWRLNRRAVTLGLAAVGRSGSLTRRIEWLLRTKRVAEPKRPRTRVIASLLTFAAGLVVGIYGPRLSFVASVDAGEETEAAVVWNEIDSDLAQTLNELDRIESQLANDPTTASLVASLRQRSRSLKLRTGQ